MVVACNIKLFHNRDRQTQRDFNASSPSSCKGKIKLLEKEAEYQLFFKIIGQEALSYSKIS